MVSHTYCSANDEVHFKDFVFFVVDYVFILAFCEMTRLQAISNVVKELAVFVLLRIEEKPEVIKNIIEKIVHNYSSLYTSRQWIDELVIFLYLTQSVVWPEVFKVLVDLAVKAVGEGLVFSEPSEESHPIVQLECLFLNTQVLIKSTDDFDEGAHNEGEESYARQHDANTDNFLQVCDRE